MTAMIAESVSFLNNNSFRFRFQDMNSLISLYNRVLVKFNVHKKDIKTLRHLQIVGL